LLETIPPRLIGISQRSIASTFNDDTIEHNKLLRVLYTRILDFCRAPAHHVEAYHRSSVAACSRLLAGARAEHMSLFAYWLLLPARKV
jgi:hypothetical protein